MRVPAAVVPDGGGLGAMFENVIGGVVSLGILVYLLWALLEPERF